MTSTDQADTWAPLPADHPSIKALREALRDLSYRPVTHPLATVATSRHHGLVVPYRKGTAKTTAAPLLTMTARDPAGLVLRPVSAVEDCTYRMLQPHEQLAAQRFPATYRVHGTKTEQTVQAGNAVPCNLAQYIGNRITQVLGS